MKENEEKNKGLHIFLLVVGSILFIVLMVMMSSSARAGSMAAESGGSAKTTVNYQGVLAQIQVIISTVLVVTNKKRGFITVCILNALSTFSGVMGALHNLSAVPGAVIPVITIATMAIIYSYLVKSDSQHLELKEQYEQIMDSNRIMQEKDEALRMLAYTDRLTGMRNMQFFREQVEEAVKLGSPFTIIHMNIDNFKSINDTFGPKTGDTALMAYAERVSGYCGQKYICARSSDEFCILLPGEQTEADVLNMIEQLRRLFGETITVQGTNLSVTASYGIVLHPRDGRNAETLLDSAVMAVYNAKANGKDRPCFYARSAEQSVYAQSVYTPQSPYVPESRYFPTE